MATSPASGSSGPSHKNPPSAPPSPRAEQAPAPRLLLYYRKTLVPELMKRFSLKNPYQVPRVTKVVLNMGVGAALGDVKIVEKAALEMGLITGQKPVITRAKKAISNFKVREGQAVGVKVTLRRKMMYEFLDRLFSVAMPRIRDFRGVDTASFDQGGNYAFGLTEQLIFPEIDYDKVTRTQGMDVVICTTASNRDQAHELLKGLGMPFKQ